MSPGCGHCSDLSFIYSEPGRVPQGGDFNLQSRETAAAGWRESHGVSERRRRTASQCRPAFAVMPETLRRAPELLRKRTRDFSWRPGHVHTTRFRAVTRARPNGVAIARCTGVEATPG